MPIESLDHLPVIENVRINVKRNESLLSAKIYANEVYQMNNQVFDATDISDASFEKRANIQFEEEYHAAIDCMCIIIGYDFIDNFEILFYYF